MTIKEKILVVFSFIGVFFSAVFYVLFQQKKDEKSEIEKNKLKNEVEKLQEENNEIKTMQEKYKQSLQESAELVHNAHSGDINSGIDLMQKLSERGKKRNSPEK